jgi:hypothetical protein
MRQWATVSVLLALVLVGSVVGQTTGATVKVTIVGGPNAGTYTLHGQVPCMIERQQGERPRTLKAAVAEPAKVANPKTLGNALFEIPLVATYPSRLIDIDLIFGELDRVAADYYVTTLDDEKMGSGTVTVAERGASATLTFQAQTDKGVTFEGVLECHAIRVK